MSTNYFEVLAAKIVQKISDNRTRSKDTERNLQIAELASKIAKIDSQLQYEKRILKSTLEGFHDANKRAAYVRQYGTKYESSIAALEKELSALQELLAALRNMPFESSNPAETMDHAEIVQVKQLITAIERAFEEYQVQLGIKRRQLEVVEEYGNVNRDKWDAEIVKFLGNNPIIRQSLERLDDISQVNGLAPKTIAENLFSIIDGLVRPATLLPEPARNDGVDFEQMCLQSLTHSGWSVNVTERTGDQGVDLLARKMGHIVAIQCKDHASPAGNGAVQEVHAGKTYYSADFAIVISRFGFTRKARELAQSLGVYLVDSSNLNSLHDILELPDN